MKNSFSHTILMTVGKYKLKQISLIIIILASIGYDGLEYWSIRTENINLTKKIEILEEALSISQKNTTKVKDENTVITESLHTEQANNALFSDQINNIAGTVGVLDKLSKTDSELLKKYSKVFFLNENYVPKKLTTIDPKYLYEKDKLTQIHTDVWPHLQALMDKAQEDSVAIQVISAYRSFGTQAILKSSYKITYGTGTANKFSADQGYSEHQLGTTVDFTTPNIGANFVGFDKTEAYKWLLAHAHEYGFIMSYPKENTYYTFEPWHFRYVGITLATKLHNENLYFYAMDQRDIDKYLVSLFD
ncbi:MAG: M15 family metallopeptidase [Minisyncoccia bacterium]